MDPVNVDVRFLIASQTACIAIGLSLGLLMIKRNNLPLKAKSAKRKHKGGI